MRLIKAFLKFQIIKGIFNAVRGRQEGGGRQGQAGQPRGSARGERL